MNMQSLEHRSDPPTKAKRCGFLFGGLSIEHKKRKREPEGSRFAVCVDPEGQVLQILFSQLDGLLEGAVGLRAADEVAVDHETRCSADPRCFACGDIGLHAGLMSAVVQGLLELDHVDPTHVLSVLLKAGAIQT